MSENTKIEWTDHSWSPWRGCTKVSPGCANCYAETLSKRNPAVLGQWGPGKPRVWTKTYNDPVKWNRRAGNGSCKCCGSTGDTTYTGNCKRCGDVTRVFARPTVFPSLCDWLDEEVPVLYLARFLELIQSTPNLTWLLLTKRPQNWEKHMALACEWLPEAGNIAADWLERRTIPHNVWVGTSVENQEWANKRIPALLDIPAVGRFLSVEPMLGPVDFRFVSDEFDCVHPFPSNPSGHPTGMIHWVIFGGESGRGARPCNVEWIRSGVRQCRAAGIPAFVNQLGAHVIGSHNEALAGFPEYHIDPDLIARWKLNHPKGGDPAEWPEDLNVRQFPW